MSDSKPKTWKTWVKDTYDAKIAADPKRFRRLDGESNREYRERCEELIASDWGMAVSTLRASKGLNRRPTLESHPKFFADLKKFGRAKFVGGKLDRESLGKGPDPLQFFRETPAGGLLARTGGQADSRGARAAAD